MSRRTLARQAALQILYQDEFNPQRSRELDREYIRQQVEEDENLSDLSWWLIDGTRKHKAGLDPEIEAAAEHWSVYRMSAVDRSLIRLAAFECRHGQTPKAVAIDEAIRLAKRFGAKDSPAFVNGVLDRLLSDEPRADSGEKATKKGRGTAVPSGDSENNAASRGGLRRFLKKDVE
jgi:N utilization substance protein B